MSNTGCINSSDNTVGNNLIERYLPIDHDYILCIDTSTSNLPEQKVNVDTIFLAGNLTSLNFVEIKLYTWAK